MPSLSNRRIITNRQLNFTLCPVDTYNSKEMPYSLPNYAIDGTWNHHQSIILDVILEKIFKSFYAKYDGLPKSWRSKKVIECINNFSGNMVKPIYFLFLNQQIGKALALHYGYDVEGKEREYFEENPQNNGISFEEHFIRILNNNREYKEIIDTVNRETSDFYNDVPIYFEITNLFKDYPILRKYKYKFSEYLHKISQTKFKMNYKVKFMELAPEYNEETKRFSHGKLTDIFYNMNDFQQIFTVDFKKDRMELNFKTPFGKMILHNTFMLDTDWIPEDALELSKNAYFIYKRFILNRVSGKNKPKEIRLWFEDIKSFLDMHWGNDRGIHATIDKAFKDMLAKGLVTGYSWNKDRIFRQYVLNFEHPQKSIEKQVDKGDKVMTLPT